MNVKPTRGEGCPPARTLEAFAVGDMHEVAAHVGGCTACTAYVEAIRVETSAWHRQHPTERFLSQLDRRTPPETPRWRLWLPLMGALGAAALAIIALVSAPEAVTFKGGALHVHRQTHTGSEPLESGARVSPGDVVALAFDVRSNGHLLVVQLDGTEATTTRFDGAVTAGAMTVPQAIELDVARGPEWFVAIFSTARLDGAALSKQLAGQSQQPRLELSCGACEVSAVRLEKP